MHATRSPAPVHPQWNIERGYKLAGIIKELHRVDADVIALQECDVACERSGCHDTGSIIMRHLAKWVFQATCVQA